MKTVLRWLACLFVVSLALVALAQTSGGLVSMAAGECTPENDHDGDGFCPPEDCDDNDPSTYPGAPELCNEKDNNCNGVSDFVELQLGRESEASPADSCGDGLDNDGDGLIDIADPECVTGFCQTTDLPGNPPGCTYPPPPDSFCVVGGSFRACAPDGSVACPEPPSGWPTVQPEEAYTTECHDSLDNDWDGLIDGDDPGCPAPEVCNGLDDDFDGTNDNGFNVGADCDNGLLGMCFAAGKYVCTADGSGTRCSAPILSPTTEGPYGDPSCSDAVDNDCDGLTDFPDDLGCTTGEVCDGLDNNGNGLVDEIFDLGGPCTAGVGACQQSGIYVCSADQQGTTCDAAPTVPGTEGPTGPTCSDGIDNDCDGLTDAADPGCGSANLAVTCALPYLNGLPGLDCTGWHVITYETNAGPGATVSAELLALDQDGNIIESKPAQAGNLAHLASRIDPDDYKFQVYTIGKAGPPSATRFDLFAPIPVLHVTVQDGLNKAQAFCSDVPYVQVLEPNGTVVSGSEGDVTNVLAALPLVDINTLLIKVDGVDLLAELGRTADECTPASPCSGDVTINERTVTVIDLKIQVEPISELSSNTLTMSLSGLGCGGHIVVIQADQGMPGWIPKPPSKSCHADDLRSKGNSSGLTVDIIQPAAQEVVAIFPIDVVGEACSGRQLAGVQINSLRLDVTPDNQEYTPGDGEDSGDLYTFAIDVDMPESDLAAGLGGTPQVGSFDRGSNRLIAEAIDDLGNRSFDTFFFGAGDLAKPGIGPLASPGGQPGLDTKLVNDAIQDAVQEMTEPAVLSAMETTSSEVQNAFVFGLTPSAAQEVFGQRCKDVSQKIVDKIRANILAVAPIYKEVSGGCSCDPNVRIWITDVQADPNQISCPLEFVDDQINITAHLPDLTIYARGYGRCKVTFLGACIAETIVDVSSTTTISDIQLQFTVTEGQMMGQPGTNPTYIEGTADVHTTGGSEVNCLASVCNWALEGLVTIFTFGSVDLDLTPQIDISQEVDISKEIGATEKDPIEVDQIKVDEEVVQSYGEVLRGDLADVQITPNGLRATLTGQFSTLFPDPEVEDTPGASLSPADPPVIHPDNALELYLGLADDTFNQLFASMTASGKLKTSCTDTTLTFGNLLPADCETILIPGKPGLTDTLQGTCHGFKGDTCADIPGDIVEKAACGLAKAQLANLNITTSTPLLLCVKQDNPPEFLITDDTNTDPVETALHLNGLSVAFLLDRNEDGFDGQQLGDTPKCLATGAPTTGDCWAYAMCLNLDLLTEMQFGTCTDGKPGLLTSFKSINIPEGGKQVGMVCGGAPPPEDDLLNQSASNSDPVTIDLTGNVDEFTPPMCAEGLDLGGYIGGLDIDTLKLIAIDAPGGKTSPFQDYLGITGNVVPR